MQGQTQSTTPEIMPAPLGYTSAPSLDYVLTDRSGDIVREIKKNSWADLAHELGFDLNRPGLLYVIDSAGDVSALRIEHDGSFKFAGTSGVVGGKKVDDIDGSVFYIVDARCHLGTGCPYDPKMMANHRAIVYRYHEAAFQEIARILQAEPRKISDNLFLNQ